MQSGVVGIDMTWLQLHPRTQEQANEHGSLTLDYAEQTFVFID